MTSGHGKHEQTKFFTLARSHNYARGSKIVCASDSLEVILSRLSTKLMGVIVDGHYLRHLNYLLEFLVAWEKRPTNLTSMAYQWCCTISEAAAGQNTY